MADIHVTVQDSAFEADEDTPVAFEAGVDSLKYFGEDTRMHVYVKCEVARRTESWMDLKPVAIVAAEDDTY